MNGNGEMALGQRSFWEYLGKGQFGVGVGALKWKQHFLLFVQ